jgi:hypothetical protein
MNIFNWNPPHPEQVQTNILLKHLYRTGFYKIKSNIIIDKKETDEAKKLLLNRLIKKNRAQLFFLMGSR